MTDTFRVEELEGYDAPADMDDAPHSTLTRDAHILKSVANLHDQEKVSGEKLVAIMRANLRELIWCRLIGRQGETITFGHDYYVSLGTNHAIDPASVPNGIFVNPSEFEDWSE